MSGRIGSARSGSTQSGRKNFGRESLPASTMEDDGAEVSRDEAAAGSGSDREDGEKSLKQGGRGRRGPLRAKPKGDAKSKPAFAKVADVDAEISRLRAPPQELSREDFIKQYPKLPSVGDNPHRYRKDTVSQSLMKELFGAACGDNGRQGYVWGTCKEAAVVKRIEYLHPILYQHPPKEIPGYLKIRFAEGVAMEFEKGPGYVDWCAFGAETNKRQRNRYKSDLGKLLALRKTFEEDKPLEVRGREWRAIKLEPGLTYSSTPRGGGGEGGRTKSRLGSTGDCEGTFDSAPGSGVCVEGEGGDTQRGGRWTQGSLSERSQEVEEVMAMMSLEMTTTKAQEKAAAEKRDTCRSNVAQSECLVQSYQRQLEDKGKRIEQLRGDGMVVDREIIKMEGIQEQLADEEERLKNLKRDFEFAESAFLNIVAGVEGHRLQLDALNSELFQLRRGKNLGTCWPRPVVYLEDSGSVFSDESNFLKITVCSLCLFPFPQSDIVVSSCTHLYHPFCASVVFVNGNKCLA